MFQVSNCLFFLCSDVVGLRTSCTKSKNLRLLISSVYATIETGYKVTIYKVSHLGEWKFLPELASLEDLQTHVSLAHVKELLALLQVVVLTLVGLSAADIKHLEMF